MKQYPSSKIKNVTVTGHGGSGKTSLSEAMLYLSGSIDRLGKVLDANTAMDFDAEEKKRNVSVSTAVAPLEWKNYKINLLDAPGLFDFAAGVSEAMRAADMALIVLSGKSGYSVGAEKAYKAAAKMKKSKAFFISKLESENANFYKVLDSLIETLGGSICPIVVPHMEGDKVASYVNLLTNQAFTYNGGKPSPTDMPDLGGRYDELRNTLQEAVASTDEALMEKYFAEEPFTPEELSSGLTVGVASGDITPVFGGDGLSCAGVDLLLDCLVSIAPGADTIIETAIGADGKEMELPVDENGSLAAVVFKTIADPFVGKLSYFKVISGKLTAGAPVINKRTGGSERINKVFYIKGAKQEDAPYIGAGDIGAVAKLSDVMTGDTLFDPAKRIELKGIGFPAPSLSMAVKPKAKGDEEKIAAGLIRLMEEDPSIKFETNTETREQILSGLGEQHLDVVTSKLKTKFGVDVELAVPKVAYRETIRKKVKVQGKHKKQSGGHGQFGDVWIEFEPCDSDSLLFEEKVFGGAVPRNFFPAVEKGLQDCMSKGVLAGYPVVGLKATLVDGSYHPVDSSEMSFKMAASIAFKAGLTQASPVLLEPIGTLKVSVPDDNMGDIIGDVNKRRGRIMGMNPSDDGQQEIDAEVPMSEMADFSTVLRSISQGRGSYILTFERYEEAPPMIAEKIMEAAKTE